MNTGLHDLCHYPWVGFLLCPQLHDRLGGNHKDSQVGERQATRYRSIRDGTNHSGRSLKGQTIGKIETPESIIVCGQLAGVAGPVV